MNNAFDSVRLFEKKLSEYTGAPHVVVVESCSAAIFLSLAYYRDVIKHRKQKVTISKRTYPSVPAAIKNTENKIIFIEDDAWQECGWYYLKPYRIVDSARYIGRNMYDKFRENFVCLSFHAKKSLPIGRGGAILTDDKKAVEWFKSARHDGRHDGVELINDKIENVGWNFTMTPEQASRGLVLMGNLKEENILSFEVYPDLSLCECFK